MLRHPPNFTLFPYTTLFRSAVSFIASALEQWTHINQRIEHTDLFFAVRDSLATVSLLGFAWLYQRQHYELDRKSTRLNSSHTVISYAVFCLKKKKKYLIYKQ